MQAGTIIDNRYRIIRPLGGGGMANVYLAHDQKLNRDVTFKIMRMDLRDRQNLVKRFQREAQAAKDLVNEHIVQIYGTGEYDGSHYMVIEYVEGMDLKEYVSQHFPIPYRKIVDIMLQILEAVEVAHDSGIIHRDLKPQNILINDDGQVKITDFGIAVAKENQNLTQTNSVIGSVHYISPEQIAGESASVQSDIYALGVILYQLITKQVPYEGETAATVALQHTTGTMPSVRNFDPTIPQPLENVVLKATAKNPEDRYVSALEMADDLQTCLSPRRAHDPRYVPLADDATRVIPLDELENYPLPEEHEKISSTTEGENIQTVVDQIIDYANRGYAIKKIAGLVDRTPRYVRKVLKDNGIKFHDKRRWLLACGLVCLLGMVIFFVNQSQTNYVKVPDLSNLSQSQATSKLESAHLVADNNVTYTTSKTVSKDEVIKTSPSVGSRVKRGSKIRLIISTGAGKIRFGDFTDSDYGATAAQLNAQGFTVKKELTTSNDVPAGKIISQSLEAGSLVDPTDTTVTFVVSSGVAKVNVPDFSGKTRNEVQAWSRANNITVSYISQTNQAPKNEVLTQSLSAGSKMSVDQTLEVTISDGPASSSSADSSSSASSSSSSGASSSSQKSSSAS
ncbi:Stk1 family PASTA domain-containing Ser/Thr kinase [Convivina praedatoris]|uniref:non-specific serine/threonine protein kinase n=1 Tax=Convivina praedatoris TaxID=2880963 RepID=A0ABN8H9U1_9LACO|nr:Stk1 family PASTA domain-containing Ser/Thr kinase [Convivina sp. LMG 32447]CAH1854282.1 Serine/threonine-protein kinase PrkC [Convivina sp. LMG 32447]CAH1855507.1 Serine/threonine-protein kinase PrkC [Convivina sp. LMG 32447]CAH1855611.1 Serine/threonine-protein kinase PrkC [Convivina sp. LMG 32447]